MQTAVAVENAINHQRHLEYARLSQDLDAARAIQQSLLPQTMPKILGYSLAARSSACYQVGGDYLDIVLEPDGSHLMVVADVAGKGLASALVCTAFRSAFRALARQSLTLKELASRLATTLGRGLRGSAALCHRDLSSAGRRKRRARVRQRRSGPRYPLWVRASGTPLGLLPGARYTTERVALPPGSRLLLHTDGLTELFQAEEEFGADRLAEAFAYTSPAPAEATLFSLWATLESFTGHAAQQDDMTAIALCRLSDTAQQEAHP